MLPDAPQNQPVPQAPVQNAAAPFQAMPTSPTGAVPRQNDQVNARAKEIITQYQHDPHALADAFQLLKSQYLADQLHIKPSAVEN